MANIGFRSLAMGSRFLLLFVLAKLLEPSDVGQFGLFMAAVSFSVLVVGGDYYTYSQRELLSEKPERWSFVLQHQVLAIVFIYGLLVPLQYLWFWFDLLPQALICWFFVLLFSEHVAQEVNRVLIAMHRPLTASWVLLIRSGIWVWIALPVMWYFPRYQNLETVYLGWSIGSALSVGVGLVAISRSVASWKWWAVDLNWIKKGFKVGLLFLIATMCFRGLLTADRYIVEYLSGADFLGVYVFFIGIAMAVGAFLDSAVISFLYPRLVKAYRQGDMGAYMKAYKELLFSILVYGLVIIGAITVFINPFLGWINRPIYQEHISTLWLLLIMSLVYNLAMIPHYALYAKGDDKGIVVAHVTALFVFFLGVVAVSVVSTTQAAAVGLIAAFLWMGGYKLWRNHLFRAACTERQGVTE